MQAITFYRYGSPDVLQLETIAKPTPSADQVLVKIHATAVNPLDWHIMRAAPFFARFATGLRKPSFNILGADIAGTVEAVGTNVTQFKPGDAVFGDISHGGLAEYICTHPDNLALKPDNISFEEAAGVGVIGFTALQGLRDAGEIQAGEKVLVNGASGGVGHMAVQIAKHLGTEVTGVCSTRNLEMVRSIGADHAIDYTTTDFARTGQQYDLIFDAVGNRTAADLARALKPNGRAVIAGFTTMPHMIMQSLLRAKWISRGGEKWIGMMETAHPNQEDLLILRDMLASGAIKPVIDRCYPLEQTADAIRYLETMRARGKVIVQIAI